jgi:hypothetical protein
MHENVRRAIVRGFYPGPKWQARVMAMSDEEVKLIHDLKVEQVREQGATDMQLQMKEERR